MFFLAMFIVEITQPLLKHDCAGCVCFHMGDLNMNLMVVSLDTQTYTYAL